MQKFRVLNYVNLTFSYSDIKDKTNLIKRLISATKNFDCLVIRRGKLLKSTEISIKLLKPVEIYDNVHVLGRIIKSYETTERFYISVASKLDASLSEFKQVAFQKCQNGRIKVYEKRPSTFVMTCGQMKTFTEKAIPSNEYERALERCNLFPSRQVVKREKLYFYHDILNKLLSNWIRLPLKL